MMVDTSSGRPRGPARLPREQLSRELDTLAHEFPGVSSELLKRLVDDALRELPQARVEAFVPLLVHRRVRQRLLVLLGSGAAPGNDEPASP